MIRGMVSRAKKNSPQIQSDLKLIHQLVQRYERTKKAGRG